MIVCLFKPASGSAWQSLWLSLLAVLDGRQMACHHVQSHFWAIALPERSRVNFPPFQLNYITSPQTRRECDRKRAVECWFPPWPCCDMSSTPRQRALALAPCCLSLSLGSLSHGLFIKCIRIYTVVYLVLIKVRYTLTEVSHSHLWHFYTS
jgi:hypothetical protein